MPLQPQNHSQPDSTVLRFHHWLETHHRLTLAALIVLAGLVFSLYVLRSPTVNKDERRDDPWSIGLNLAQGNGYVLCASDYFPFCKQADQHTAMREPVMVLLFAAAAWLLGPSVVVALLVELLLFLGILILIHRLGRTISGDLTGLLAALLWIFYLPLGRLFQNNTGELSATLFLTLAVLFTLRASNTRPGWNLAAAGVFAGLAALSRSAALAPAIVIFVMVLAGGKRPVVRWSTRPALIFLVALVLTLAPWLVRNQVILGKPMMTSLTWYNVYRHNAPIQTDNYFRYVYPDEAARQVQALISTAHGLKGNENEAAMDNFYRQAAVTVIAAHPGRFLAVSLYRFVPLWFNLGAIKDWKFQDSLVLVEQVFILFTGLLGFWFSRPRRWLFFLCVASLTAAYMAVDAQVRYLTPVMPLAMLLSAEWLARLVLRKSESG